MTRLMGRVLVVAALLVSTGCDYMGYDLTGDGYVATFQQEATRLEWQWLPPLLNIPREEAREYCAELSLQGDGWRLPAKEELHALRVDRHKFSTVPGIKNGEYWSLSTDVTNAENGWVVYFHESSGSHIESLLTENSVRCVR